MKVVKEKAKNVEKTWLQLTESELENLVNAAACMYSKQEDVV